MKYEIRSYKLVEYSQTQHMSLGMLYYMLDHVRET